MSTDDDDNYWLKIAMVHSIALDIIAGTRRVLIYLFNYSLI